ADNKITLSSANTFTVAAGDNTLALGLAATNAAAGGAVSAFTLPSVAANTALELNVGGTVTSINVNPTAGGTGLLEGAGGIIEQINKQTANTGVTASVDAATGGLKLQGTSAFTIETAVTGLGLVADVTPQTNVTGTENLRDAKLSVSTPTLVIGATTIGL